MGGLAMSIASRTRHNAEATRLFAPDTPTLERIVQRWPVADPDA